MGKTLPENWKVVRIGDISRLIRGVTYVKQDAINDPKEGFVPILRANNIDAKLNYDELIYIPSNKVKEEQYIKTDDILIAMSSGSKNLVGKAAQSRIAFNGGFGAFCGLVRVNKNINRKLIGFFFQSSYYRKEVERLSIGANINNLRREHIETIKIPLPPLPTQHKIVEILEEADNLRKLRQKADEKMKDLIPSLFIQMFGDPATNPKGWEMKNLGEVLRVKSGKFLPAKSMNMEGDYPVYGGNGVNGYHNSYMFDEPKIVIGRVGAYCGCVHLSQPKSWITDNALYVSEKLKNFDNKFMVTYLAFLDLNEKANNMAQPQVSGKIIYQLRIPLPPLPLQQEFAERVKEIEEEKERQAGGKKKLDELFNSLMQRAFTGELVA